MKYEDLRIELERLKVQAQTQINIVDTLPNLEKARIDFFGRNGRITKFMKNMGKISVEDRPKLGTAANDIRTELTISFNNRLNFIHEVTEIWGHDDLDGEDGNEN